MTSKADVTQTQVLVVDDRLAHRAYAKCVFEALGCEVQIACDGSEAVAAARETAFDIILMDRQMPVLDGDMATRRIRAGGLSSKAVILCHVGDVRVSPPSGLYDRLVAKPVTTYQVLDLVPGKPRPQLFKFDLKRFPRVRRSRLSCDFASPAHAA
jgi:CheY-like chemotaxis protein